jgi:hypothetical protein
MEKFTFEDLKQIMDQKADPCISIYLPMHRLGAETRQNPIRFRNTLNDIKKELDEKALDNRILDQAYNMVEDNDFWQNQAEGLAMFISKDFFKYYRLPTEFIESHNISERFVIKPLVPVLTNDGKFFVLSLNQKSVHFFECTKYTCNELDVPELPKDIEEALGHEIPNTTLQFHSSGGHGNMAIHHGQGSMKDQQKDRVTRFFNEVDHGLEGILKEQKAPLIIAGVSYYLPYFRDVSSYQHIYEKSIEGNPEDLKANELHEKAWELIKPHFEKSEKEKREQFVATSGTPMTSNDPKVIAAAAFTGRIETLFIDKEDELWGKFDETGGNAEIHTKKTKGDQDLSDLISYYTLHHHGNVYVVESDNMPLQSRIAAIFRY